MTDEEKGDQCEEKLGLVSTEDKISEMSLCSCRELTFREIQARNFSPLQAQISAFRE